MVMYDDIRTLSEMTFDEIEATLRLDPNVRGFVRPPQRTLPEINLGIWVSARREKIARKLNSLSDYLFFPYLEDHFDDHEKRRAWRNRMCAKYAWFHDFCFKNPTRNNMIGVATGSANELQFGYQGTNYRSLKGHINGILAFNESLPSYNSWPFEAKINRANELKVQIYGLFDFLGEQNSQVGGKPISKAA
jgi:hypothetical protein